MYRATYEHRDWTGKVYHLNARIGGFSKEASAVKAIVCRGGVGYVSNAAGHILFVVRSGRKVT